MLFQNHLEQLLCLGSVGFALILAGAGNALLRQSQGFLRGLITLSSVAVSLGAVWLLAPEVGLVRIAAACMGLAFAPFLLIDLARRTGLTNLLSNTVRKPQARWALVSAAGVLIAIGSVVAFEQQEAVALEESMSELDELTSAPDLRPSPRLKAVTDRGRMVLVQEPVAPRTQEQVASAEERYLRNSGNKGQTLIRLGSASDQTNCHGWVFTGGQCWVGGSEVDGILSENNYQPVEVPQPGDLAIYRSGSDVKHTSIVRYVTPGLPVMVEGKWGASGIYLHAVDQSCYGNEVTYYRSSRAGHVLSVSEYQGIAEVPAE